LDRAKIEWKRNFGCIPTQHDAYNFMGHELGDFPNSEYVGDYGIHIGTHHYLSESAKTKIKFVICSYFDSVHNWEKNMETKSV